MTVETARRALERAALQLGVCVRNDLPTTDARIELQSAATAYYEVWLAAQRLCPVSAGLRELCEAFDVSDEPVAIDFEALETQPGTR